MTLSYMIGYLARYHYIKLNDLSIFSDIDFDGILFSLAIIRGDSVILRYYNDYRGGYRDARNNSNTLRRLAKFYLKFKSYIDTFTSEELKLLELLE